MNKPGLSKWAIVFLLAGFSGLLLGMNRSKALLESEDANLLAAQEKILASSIQLGLYTHGTLDSGATYEDTAVGLGTLIDYGGQQFIMTHNHWPSINEGLARVELRDGSGALLLEMDGATFNSLVRYQDEGTLLLLVPPFSLAGVIPASLGDGQDLTEGDLLLMATRDKEGRDRLSIAKAQVEWAETAGLPREIRLQGNKTAVAQGDSGGGVWHDGQLIGNTWAIIQKADNSPWPWNTQTGELNPTGAILVAGQPLDGGLGITESDLAGSMVAENNFEGRSKDIR